MAAVAETDGAGSLGLQAMEAHRAKEESTARKVWLHAWNDPVAGLRAFSPCVRLADLNGDGDAKLLVAGLDKKLRVYKGTSLLSENILLDAPVRRTRARARAPFRCALSPLRRAPRASRPRCLLLLPPLRFLHV